METNALLVLDTWANATEFKTDLINTMKSNGLNIITDLEATDIVLAVNYMTSLIYSYYKNYYLSNASKERTLELMSITASGKLNFYASQLKAYKDAYAHDFKSLGGNENSSSHDTTLKRSGKSKQATTPETIATGTDYIDDYSSSEQKYENSNTENGSRSYNSNIKGSEQDYWKNIISIPKRLFEDIIGSFSKFFFSSSMELTPCAVLTIEQALQKMKEEIKNIDTTTKTEIETLSTLIKSTQTQVSNLQESIATIDSNVQKLDNKVSMQNKKINETNVKLENLTKVTPTDVAIKNNKFGLEHDNTWLTNQNAINLGDNLTYDEATKTLNAKGGNGTNQFLVIDKLPTSISVESYQKLKNKEIYLIYQSSSGSTYKQERILTYSTYIRITCNYTLIRKGITELSSFYTLDIKIKEDGSVERYEGNELFFGVENSTESYDKFRYNNFLNRYYYFLRIINDTATPKVLKCVNSTFSWVELPKYYEHNGMLKVGDNYIMFKYTSTDSVAITDFSQIISDLSGNYIMGSGMFMYDGVVENVYGIDFEALCFSTNEILSSGTLSTNEVPFSDLTLGSYSENVRPIE